MRALTFEDVGKVAIREMAEPRIEEPTDALLRVTMSAICGSDLHVFHGRVPGMRAGSVLGHEFIGVVEEAGSAVSRFGSADRTLASFMIPCGRCWYCSQRLFSRCLEGRVFGFGDRLGDLNGGQAEYVRVPNADLALHPVEPQLTDEQALFAGDIFTTGLECASEARIQSGDTAVVLGCGPVGLLAIQAAASFGPARIFAVDTISDRLFAAARFGAIAVDASSLDVAAHIREQTEGRGADCVLECVGAIPVLLSAIDIARPGGRISVIGVHSDREMNLPLGLVFRKALDLKFCGVANIVGGWDKALEMIRGGVVDPAAIISHRMSLSEAVKGYELFEKREALKVVLTP